MSAPRLDELIQRHLDGALSRADREELEQALLASAEARRRFWDETAWHGLLHEAAQLRWADAAPRRARWGWPAGIGLAAAAALLLLLHPATPPAPRGPAWIAGVEGSVEVAADGASRAAVRGEALRPGAALRVGAGGRVQVAYADGTALTLDAGTALTFGGTNLLDLALAAGRVDADVHPQPAGRLLAIATPLARATVHGTRFSLAAGEGATDLHVSRGLVRLTHAQRDSEVDVAGGEFARALPGAELVAGLEPADLRPPPVSAHGTRDPVRQPFASNSPWNIALCSGARLEPVRSAALDLARRGAAVLPASHDRALFTARADDPEVEVADRYTGLPLARIRAPGDALRGWTRPATATLLDPAEGVAHELALADRGEDGLRAMLCREIDLRGTGIPPAQAGHTFGGFPVLAGVIRAGELARGTPHALAASALHTGLSRGPDGGAHVWPSRHVPLENKLLARMGAEGNVRFGTLLALPPSVDLAALGVGTNGPAYELARALQDYGAYVTHSYGPAPADGAGGWVQPALQFFAESEDADALRALSAAAARIVPLLQVVANNAPGTPGGGGSPRRPPADGLQ